MKTTCTFSVFHFHVVLVTTSFGAGAAFISCTEMISVLLQY